MTARVENPEHAAAAATIIGYRLSSGVGGFAFEPLTRAQHRSDRSRIEVEDPSSASVGIGIALVLGSEIDPHDVGSAVRYALPCLEVVDGDRVTFVIGNPPSDPALSADVTTATATLDGSPATLAFEDPRPAPLAMPSKLGAHLDEHGHTVRPGAFLLTGRLASLQQPDSGFIAADLGHAGRVHARIARPGSPVVDDQPPWGMPVNSNSTSAIMSIGRFETILDPDDGGPDPWCVNDHCFAKDRDGRWHVFAITHPKPYDHELDPGTHLAHATSPSLTAPAWRVEPFALAADPSRGEHLLWSPHIVEVDGVFHMFVCVGAERGHRFAIRRFVSDDLWSWRRTDGGPVLVDGVEARDPMVLRDGDRWILYYTATERPDGGKFVVAAVSSTDLVSWDARRVVFTHPREGAFGGPTESPFVVRRGTTWYLFVTDDEVVHVYASGDALHWSPDDRVFAYRGRACELVRDERGSWFISHVGWELGGLAIAPLTWYDGLGDLPASIEAARA